MEGRDIVTPSAEGVVVLVEELRSTTIEDRLMAFLKLPAGKVTWKTVRLALCLWKRRETIQIMLIGH